jgi:flavin reductase (DIM6/NTAB) family NADH-FMN oxidoreductase RutF
MYIDFSTIDARTAYFWMASTVVPRPVAWVSTCSNSGVNNLAPFSFFQVITPSPPTLMISPLLHADGAMKDTARNIAENGEFVVNLVRFTEVERMNQTSGNFAVDQGEASACGVTMCDSVMVRPPRVAAVAVSFECRLASLMPYPAKQPSCHVIFGEVVAAHIDEAILGADGQIDPVHLNLVSRMGADWYGRTSGDANFTLARPPGWNQRPNQK